MEVVGLIPGRDHVCTRYRIAQYEEHMRAAGLRLRLEPLAQGLAGRLRQMSRRRDGQIVLLVRKLLPVWQLLLLRQNSRVLVYDFDDAVFYRDSFHRRGPYSITRRLRFHATMRLADHVFAGNTFLADEARRYTHADKIMVIPTCVDAKRYRPAHHNDHQPTKLVWIGSSSTLRALEASRPLLESIGKQIPNAVLRVICDQFPRFKYLRVEPAPWSSETETADLGGADIGISCLPDDAWSQGKCGLKILQYMAAGLPVVASPVGVHREMIRQDLGFLPASPADWVDTVRRLANDHHLRDRLGREGRNRLERHFHVDTWGPILAGQLKEAAACL